MWGREGEQEGGLCCTSRQWPASEPIIPKDALGSYYPGEGEILSHLFLMSFVKEFFNRLLLFCDATSGLEKQRRKAQDMLYDMKEDDEERPELEEEYCHFKLCSLSFKEGYRCA